MPPQIPLEESEETHFVELSSKDFQPEPSKKSPSKSKTTQSSSLPRRFGDIFGSRKTRSQTLQPKTDDIDASSKNMTLTNGTEALTVDVGEKDESSEF